jgi:hypothetical protein
MTDFEKTIKREITREKFEAIRDHKYGGNNVIFFDYTYGNVSSWLTWNRDEKGRIVKGNIPEDYSIKLKEAIRESVNGGHFWDGPIDDWDKDKLLPPDRQITRKITSDIVFIGFNMSAEPIPGPCFQNARGHKRLVITFFGTEAEGGYFTDIIKSDKRILDSVKKLSVAEEVKAYLKKNPKTLKDHVQIFTDELKFIGAENPLLIVLGRHAEWAVKVALDMKFLDKNKFRGIVFTMHYAGYPKGGDEGYMAIAREDLAKYVTIPAFGSNFPDNMGR